MIYIMAASLEDARGWCHWNGVDRGDVVYLGNTWNLPGRIFAESDRIVRTERAREHPGHPEIERMVKITLLHCHLTETNGGRLVPQVV